MDVVMALPAISKRIDRQLVRVGLPALEFAAERAEEIRHILRQQLRSVVNTNALRALAPPRLRPHPQHLRPQLRTRQRSVVGRLR